MTLENFKTTVEKGEPVVATGIEGQTYTGVIRDGKKQPDGPVKAAPESSAPLVREPPIAWDCLRLTVGRKKKSAVRKTKRKFVNVNASLWAGMALPCL